MRKSLATILAAGAISLLVAPSAQASVGTKCAKAGTVNQSTGLKCVRKKGKLSWVQFYAVPGKPAFVDFAPATGVLAWGNPVSWGNPVATIFVIQMRSTVALDWATMVETSVANRSATVTNLASGVGYEFRIAARNSYGLGEFSNSKLSYAGSVTSTTIGGGIVGSTTTSTTVGPTTTTTTTVAPTTTTTTTTTLAGTVSQRNAVSKAASYLRSSAFSRSGLISQLEYSGFSQADAIYGTDAQNADWNQQAVRKGASYLRSSSFSRLGLIGQLEYSGFSNSEATYGTDAQNADWFAQAAKKAASYMRSSSFSRAGLINQLLYEEFTQAQAEYGASSVGL